MERKDVPSIDVVEVREEEDPKDEKSDQHKSPIHFVQQSVLLFVLRVKKREGEKETQEVQANNVNILQVIKGHSNTVRFDAKCSD